MKMYDDSSKSSIAISNHAGSHYNHLRPLISKDSRKVFLSNGHNISAYSIISGHLLQTLKGHNQKIIGICDNPLEKDSLISCDLGGNIIIWNLHDPAKKIQLSLMDLEEVKNEKVCYFSISKDETLLYAIESIKKKKILFSSQFSQPKMKKTKIIGDIKHISNSITLSKNGMFLGILQSQCNVVVFEYPFKSRYRHISSAHATTCIACHPEEDTIAVGDVIGKITIFYSFLKGGPKAYLHWHTLPVADLVFSSKGTELYSGGGECVLVQWQLTEERRYFLPRLGAPLEFIATDHSNASIVVIHRDRDVSVLNAKERRLEGKISRLMYHDSVNPLPIGLLAYPGTSSVILNGRTGHLQFYEPLSDNLIYHLDITMCNYLSKERHKELPNPEVMQAAVSSDASWLATCEVYPLSPRIVELILKFWLFSQENQRWELNTSIQTPHNVSLNGISFIPSSFSDVPLCVTCGDEKFKMWQLFNYKDANGRNRCNWNCIASKEFRDLPATACCFSPDGSLLAVSFNSILTMWKVDECSFIRTLTQPFLTERIKQIFFCGGEYEGAVLITQSQNRICSWDLLSCCLLWNLSLSTTQLVVNPLSGYVAAFSKTNKVYILSPKSCQVLASKPNVSDSEVLGAAFVPFARSEGKESDSSAMPWKSLHNLVFVTRDQLFYTVDLTSDAADGAANPKNLENEADSKDTPFAALLPTTRKTLHSEEKTSVKNSSSQLKFIELLDNTRVHNMDSFATLLQSCDPLVPPPHISKKKIDFEYSTKKLTAAFNQVPLEELLETATIEDENDQKLIERIQNIDYKKIANLFS